MRKQTPLQRKMKQKEAAKKHREKKRAEAAYRREMTKQAKDKANFCSEPWNPDIESSIVEDGAIGKSGEKVKFTRTTTSIKKILSDDDATTLFTETKLAIRDLENIIKKIKRQFYQLECGDAFFGLKYKSESDVFKELSEVSLRHLSMLQRFRNAAIIEVELGRLHDQIPTNILLELKAGTDEKSRKEIWNLINIDCLRLGRSDDGKFPLPTVEQVKRIKKNYFYNSPEAIAKRESLDDEIYDILDSNVETSVDEGEWGEREFREFIEDDDDDKYDFTDKEIKTPKEERDAFVVDKHDNLTDAEIKEYEKDYQAAFAGCKLTTSESTIPRNVAFNNVGVDIKKKFRRKRIQKSAPSGTRPLF